MGCTKKDHILVCNNLTQRFCGKCKSNSTLGFQSCYLSRGQTSIEQTAMKFSFKIIFLQWVEIAVSCWCSKVSTVCSLRRSNAKQPPLLIKCFQLSVYYRALRKKIPIHFTAPFSLFSLPLCLKHYMYKAEWNRVTDRVSPFAFFLRSKATLCSVLPSAIFTTYMLFRRKKGLCSAAIISTPNMSSNIRQLWRFTSPFVDYLLHNAPWLGILFLSSLIDCFEQKK